MHQLVSSPLKRSIALLIIFINALSAFSQTEEILSIDGKPVLKEEFVRLYQKNNMNLMEESEKKNPKKYMELFINYKLKVHDAKQNGLDTIASFINELKQYRNELAKPYLTDVSFSEKMILEAYTRTKNEVKASHILLNLDPQASPDDTLKVYTKLLKIRERALNEENFETLAQQLSEDPSARTNKGVLGYFSAFQMVFPFEEAAYKTAIGDISMPVRSRFGYHLIHVLDKRESKGQIKVAHIMKRISEDANSKTIELIKQQMDSIAHLIQSGDDFSKLASKFSDDRRSASRGGEMSWFGSSGMLPQFAEPAFALKKDNDVSPVIRTPYGWHIIKRIDLKPIAPFEEMKPQLIEKIKKNPAISKHSKQLFINKLKNEYAFNLNTSAYKTYKLAVKDKLKAGTINKEMTNTPDQTLFSFANTNIKYSDFSSYIYSVKNKKQPIDKLFDAFVEQQLIDYENENLENKYPDFKYLMKEYHEGILLFNISEAKIWSKAASDSTGLASFYEKTKDKYKWDERFSGWVIKCPNQKVKDFVDEVLSTDDQIGIEELQDQIKQHFQLTVDAQKGDFEKSDNDLIDYLVWNNIRPTDFKEGLHFVRGNKHSPKIKQLNEAKGLYIADYQTFLESQWIKELRKRHKVKVNKKALKTIDAI